MIQRIQTVYLLAAGLLTASLFKLDFADLLLNNELYTFNVAGIIKGDETYLDGLSVMIFTGLITLLHLVAIFLYKNRIRQIRVVVFTIILLIGLFGLFFYFIFAGMPEARVVYNIPMAFPLIAIILDYLAIRTIGKDEALVRSLNRIR